MKARLTIGAVAKQLGIPTSTIRFYEAKGILPPPERTRGGYRAYSPEDVRRIRLATRARLLGLDLPTIRDLVQSAFASACTEFVDTLLARIEAQQAIVEHQIAELSALRLELSAAATHVRRARGVVAPGQRVADCPSCPLIDEEGR